ncbi:MAG: LysR family transcriptional regulator [Burkholderiaceae bacterium]
MIDQLKSLAVFVYVVEEGSFRAASARLELSPSVVSHHINQLEKKLGVALFYRSTRTISLTEDGSRLLQSATDMIAAAENSLGMYATSAENRLINMRVAIPNMLQEHPLFDRIVKFAKIRPGIKLILMSSDTALNLIKENVDVAIRVGKLSDSEFKARKIGQDRRVTVASTTLLERYEKLTHPNQLSTWDCISFSSVPDVFYFKRGRSNFKVWGVTAAATDTVSTMQRLCIAGVGVAGLPYESAKADIDKRKLIEILPDWSNHPLDIYALWAKNAELKKHTRDFVDYLVNEQKN